MQYQLIRLSLIKSTVETLQDLGKKAMSQKEKYLCDKKNLMRALDHKKLQLKPLTDSLEDVEQTILKLEKVIQEKKIEYAVLKESIIYWQKKRDCAHISLENANLTRDINRKTIQELNNELKQIGVKLAEFREVSEQSAIELSNFQVLC